MGFFKLIGVLAVVLIAFAAWRLCAEGAKADEQISRMFRERKEK